MCGYQRGPLPHILECRWYGDISQRCLNPYSQQYTEVCPKPWLQAGFSQNAISEQQVSLAGRLHLLRQKYITSGKPLLTPDEVLEEVRRRRGEEDDICK